MAEPDDAGWVDAAADDDCRFATLLSATDGEAVVYFVDVCFETGPETVDDFDDGGIWKI